MRITVARAAAGDRLLAPAEIVVSDDRFVSVEPYAGPVEHGLTALPGLVDTHCHGAVGVDFGSATVDQVRRVLAFWRTQGTTTLMASLVTAEVDDLCRQLERLAPLVAAGELAGLHLEGPFLARSRCGAHDPELLREPTAELVGRLLDAGAEGLRMVTIAPELPGAREAIARLVGAGVRVGIGHTEADATTTRAGIEDGATIATHLFNAMPSIHHREPGPVPVLLDDRRVAVELIVDGVHLADETVALARRAAGRDRTVLVSDAMAATGLADGCYRVGGLEVEVRDRVARTGTGALAGSTTTLARALERLGLDEVSSAYAGATAAARLHGLDEVGEIAPGRYADLVLVDEARRLHRVLHRGRWVDQVRSDRATCGCL